MIKTENNFSRPSLLKTRQVARAHALRANLQRRKQQRKRSEDPLEGEMPGSEPTTDRRSVSPLIPTDQTDNVKR